MGRGPLFLLAPFGGAVSFGIDDGPVGAGVKAGAAFLTEVLLYVKANLELAFNCIFRALFGAGAAPLAIFTDVVWHEKKDSADCW